MRPTALKVAIIMSLSLSLKMKIMMVLKAIILKMLVLLRKLMLLFPVNQLHLSLLLIQLKLELPLKLLKPESPLSIKNQVKAEKTQKLEKILRMVKVKVSEFMIILELIEETIKGEEEDIFEKRLVEKSFSHNSIHDFND